MNKFLITQNKSLDHPVKNNSLDHPAKNNFLDHPAKNNAENIGKEETKASLKGNSSNFVMGVGMAEEVTRCSRNLLLLTITLAGIAMGEGLSNSNQAMAVERATGEEDVMTSQQQSPLPLTHEYTTPTGEKKKISKQEKKCLEEIHIAGTVTESCIKGYAGAKCDINEINEAVKTLLPYALLPTKKYQYEKFIIAQKEADKYLVRLLEFSINTPHMISLLSQNTESVKLLTKFREDLQSCLCHPTHQNGLFSEENAIAANSLFYDLYILKSEIASAQEKIKSAESKTAVATLDLSR